MLPNRLSLLKSLLLLLFATPALLFAIEYSELKIETSSAEWKEAIAFAENWRSKLVYQYGFEEQDETKTSNFCFWSYSSSDSDSELLVSLAHKEGDWVLIQFSYQLKGKSIPLFEETLFPEIEEASKVYFRDENVSTEKNTLFVCN